MDELYKEVERLKKAHACSASLDEWEKLQHENERLISALHLDQMALSGGNKKIRNLRVENKELKEEVAKLKERLIWSGAGLEDDDE